MIWKTIGKSVAGTSHILYNKPCEDAISYDSIKLDSQEEVLICAVSDGAGSAKYAAEASSYITKEIVIRIKERVELNSNLGILDIFPIIEDLFDDFRAKAHKVGAPLNEFSCTLLGCVAFSNRAIFFQVGDGAIVRNDGAGYYTSLWWPHNGEYQNTTSFFIDDRLFSNLRITEVEEPINEIAIFSDGLQLLVLNNDSQSVHQPFFQNIFKPLRMADDISALSILERRLDHYLSSEMINSRTDDDKTLFLATRLNHDE